MGIGIRLHTPRAVGGDWKIDVGDGMASRGMFANLRRRRGHVGYLIEA